MNDRTSPDRFAEKTPQIGTKLVITGNMFILRHSLNTQMTSRLNYSVLVQDNRTREKSKNRIVLCFAVNHSVLVPHYTKFSSQ